MPIEHISDTARWVAVYRAMETDRPDRIFNDPFARKLAGERGEEIVAAMKRGRQMAWAMIVRTAVFDEIIMEKLKGGGVDLVLNLAAGLDARPWRLALPPALRWVDVDLPAILNYKMETLRDVKPACRYEAVTTDLTDASKRHALFTQLGAQARRALIVTEGLLIYLTPEQVGALGRDLHAPPSFHWWLTDIASPRLLKIMHRMWDPHVSQAAAFQFAPAEGTQFFRQFGWQEVQFRPAMEEARRLHREMKGMWFWRLLVRFYPKRVRDEIRRMSGAALLERI